MHVGTKAIESMLATISASEEADEKVPRILLLV
jgi:hypothetical protein